ncbi:hypothetical protein JD844_031532 [Phrynosoma platyrhinos]|uniref:OCA domain-containing protein n=1 Tax=Phrynosoma platyrhinos TaxID=52577 RepID=A0ABQ7T0T8_PHRPL|nr:hypothetical protein JD844_031532 [Phrynosoma platyrhinos]
MPRCSVFLPVLEQPALPFKEETASASEQPPSTPRPYQGVRVKEPVKELLKRKRGSLQNANVAAAATTTVFFPHQSLPSYSPTGQVCTDSEFVASSLPVVDDGTLYSGWLAQPTQATLQPLTQWAAYPDYVSHEAVSCPYTGDMSPLMRPLKEKRRQQRIEMCIKFAEHRLQTGHLSPQLNLGNIDLTQDKSLEPNLCFPPPSGRKKFE